MIKQSKIPGCLGAKLRSATTLLAVSVLAIGVAGCGHRMAREETSGFIEHVKTVEQMHPIEVEKARATLSLNVPGNARGLNVYQKERVLHFISNWREEGTGSIAVSGNNREALADLRDILIERAVPVGAVQVVGYDAGQPGIKLSFARYIAEGPKCGKFDSNLAEDSGNTEYTNFGCAAQHNMAALVSNPKDLLAPRDQVDWTDANRRDFIYRAYIKGSNTAGETATTDKAGTISDVAKH